MKSLYMKFYGVHIEGLVRIKTKCLVRLFNELNRIKREFKNNQSYLNAIEGNH